MPDNDYIILYDETGQPYIEHISLRGAYSSAKNKIGSVYNAARAKAAGVKNYGVGRGVRVNHKYIAKIGNRYIYDAKELAAAKAKQAKGAVTNAAKNAKGTVNKVKNKVKDIAGVDERERRDAADKEVTRVGNTTNWRRSKEYDSAVAKAEKAQKEYDRTPLGMIDTAKDYANAGKYHATNAANKVKDKVKDIAGVDERERMTEAKNALDSKKAEGAKKRAEFDKYKDDMIDKYGDNYQSKMSKAESKHLDKLGDEYWDGLVRQQHNKTRSAKEDTLKDKYDQAKAEYGRTPLGTVDYYKKKLTGKKKK